MKSPRRKNEFHLHVYLTPELRLGPGKAELLDRIAKTGSISAAAKAMDMSYRRAWLLLDELNTHFREPVVVKSKGGRGGGGGAALTPWGKSVLALYGEIVAKSQHASAAAIAKLRKNLAPAN